MPPERFARIRLDVIETHKKVKKFVDQHVAHNDRSSATAPSWHDLDSSIETLDRNLRALGLAAFGREIPARAAPQEDWKAPFRAGLFTNNEAVS